ncbi:MAG: 4Fe-4S cluster-binding domain-containing protein, partial [Bacillota bacterium]|nr:4Fe-4S cluster-binding domain-containing protein [Bacillota bacterium]
MELENCTVCPRKCGADRVNGTGFCGGGRDVKLARAALHFWEEPCISGKNGSGAVFFSGCPLKCCFCQNYEISSGNFGMEISVERLSGIFLKLQDQNACNINLVSPTHYAPFITEALDLVRGRLKIPVIWNSSGYECAEKLEGYADIYLPDIKYLDSSLSARYSSAPDYFDVASKAVLEMHRQAGTLEFDENGMLRRGLIVRHLIMPGGRRDSIKIIEWLAENLPKDGFLLSLMSQYAPCYRSGEYPEINRRITTLEYKSVLDRAAELGLHGYMQDRSSAD